MNLKQYNAKTLKAMLNEAMERGNIGQVDAISQEIIQREGLEVMAAMPEQFAEKIMGLAQEREPLKSAGRKRTARKPILILAASFVLLLGLGAADYAADAYDYVLDDGTLRLFWNHKDKKANCSLTVIPKGAFPYMGRQYEGSAFLSQKLEGAYSYTSKQGIEFYCIPASSMASAAPTLTGYVAFAAVNDKTIVIEMNGEFDDIQAEKEWKAIDQRYDEKAKKELGLTGLDQLTEKAEAWRAAAMEENLAALNKADQLFELNGDDSGLNALREKYSRCTKAEQELYRACVKEAQAVNRFYPVEQKAFENFLDVLGEI